MTDNNARRAADPPFPGDRLVAKLPISSKISYGLGDTANAFSWSFISSYLMIFYTDVFGISAYVVSLLFLVGRLWDAVNDIAVGYFADKTVSRWGRYRPWILFGILPLAVSTVLVFWAHPEFSEAGKIAYAFITYGIVVLAYTCINIPYTALAAAMTQNTRERGSLAGYRMALALAGALITAQFGARLVPALTESLGGNAELAYLLTAVILVMLAVPLYAFCFRNTREIVAPSEPLPKGYLRIALSTSLHNKPLVIAIIAHFLVGLTIYGRMSVVTYYFTYNVGDPAMAGTCFLLMQGPMMVGSFVGPFLADRMKSKGRAISLGFTIYGILSLANLAVTPLSSPAAFWGLIAVANFSQGIGYSLTYAIIPDTVEYNEYRFGVRNDGVAASLTTFWNKVGMAIGTSATAATLGMLNYMPGAAQSAATLTSINIVMFALPGVAAIVVAIVFFAYKLDYAEYGRIIAQLREKKASETKEEAKEQ